MKKILVVEDNDLNMKLFYDILTYQKYDVDKASDGEIAYEMLVSGSYDLVILDIQLPKMSGFEVIEKLKKEEVQIPPVIIASAFAMDSDKIKAKNLGVDTYLTKPIDINNFVKAVKSKLED